MTNWLKKVSKSSTSRDPGFANLKIENAAATYAAAFFLVGDPSELHTSLISSARKTGHRGAIKAWVFTRSRTRIAVVTAFVEPGLHVAIWQHLVIFFP